MTQEDNLYNILGILPSATATQIKDAYKKQSMQYHPDKGGDESMFKKISDAYEVLKSPEKRKRYDILINLVKVDNVEVQIVQPAESKIKFDIKQARGNIEITEVIKK